VPNYTVFRTKSIKNLHIDPSQEKAPQIFSHKFTRKLVFFHSAIGISNVQNLLLYFTALLSVFIPCGD